jgi:type IV pilus assembly protein PilA
VFNLKGALIMKTIQKGFTLIELMIVVAIIGILAAVAIPAYGDYTARAQAAEAFTLLDGFKTPLTELYTSNGTFGVVATTGTADDSHVAGIVAGKYVASVTVPATAGSTSLQATFKTAGISSRLLSSGGALSVHMFYNPVTGGWTCANGDASADIAGSSVVATTVATTGPATTQIPSAILPKSCGA